MTDPWRLDLCVISNNPHHLARAHEALARVQAGLALEGIETHLGTSLEAADCEDCEDHDA